MPSRTVFPAGFSPLAMRLGLVAVASISALLLMSDAASAGKHTTLHVIGPKTMHLKQYYKLGGKGYLTAKSDTLTVYFSEQKCAKDDAGEFAQEFLGNANEVVNAKVNQGHFAKSQKSYFTRTGKAYLCAYLNKSNKRAVKKVNRVS